MKPTCAGWSRRRLTLAELQTELWRRWGARRLSTIDNALRRIRLRHKKGSLRAAKQYRSAVAGQRRRWRVWQRFMEPARFVFLDETATATTMTRR